MQKIHSSVYILVYVTLKTNKLGEYLTYGKLNFYAVVANVCVKFIGSEFAICKMRFSDFGSDFKNVKLP